MVKRITKRQKTELKVIEYFIPSWMNWNKYIKSKLYNRDILKDDMGEDAEQVFFDYSDRGIPIKGRKVKKPKRLKQLLWGKKWREIHCQETTMWQGGILNGSVPYDVLLSGDNNQIMPREVVNHMKKALFNGLDADIIEKHYQEIINEKEKEQFKE